MQNLPLNPMLREKRTVLPKAVRVPEVDEHAVEGKYAGGGSGGGYGVPGILDLLAALGPLHSHVRR